MPTPLKAERETPAPTKSEFPSKNPNNTNVRTRLPTRGRGNRGKQAALVYANIRSMEHQAEVVKMSHAYLAICETCQWLGGDHQDPEHAAKEAEEHTRNPVRPRLEEWSPETGDPS